jgi:3-deoxy-D-manno-octulosonate 8-phosphate phosphatase (KDO 8-P phosphatase)
MRWIAPAGVDKPLLARAARIRLAVFDVDGVLTDGSLHYGPDGEEQKVFNTLDGHGLKMLAESGVTLAIISGRSSRALARRAKDLGISQLHMGIQDKRRVFEQVLADLTIDADEAAGLGDDIVDLPFLIRCGLAAGVPSCPQYMREYLHYVTCAAGGRGAVREFCELIMHARGKLLPALSQFVEK